MLDAANSFAEALNDSKRAEKLVEIKTQLETSVEEIVQHQYLLERKLRDQLEDIARRRAELDELERCCIISIPFPLFHSRLAAHAHFHMHVGILASSTPITAHLSCRASYI